MMWAKSNIYCKQKNVKYREKIYREEWEELGIIWIERNRNWKGNVVCSWKQLISSYCFSLGLTINAFSIPDVLSLMYFQVNQIKMCSCLMNNQVQSKHLKIGIQFG